MTYNDLCKRLTAVYDHGEAVAVARMVLERAFGLSLTDICCGKVTQLSADESQRLEEMTRRLCSSEPVQYVLGEAVFGGRTYHVDGSVLIPRPETEGLCALAVEAAAATTTGGRVRILDIGTGSGCIATTLALDVPGSDVTAWDISPEAIATATGNAQRLGATVRFVLQDALHAPADDSLWDIIVSNPPYIRHAESRDMHPNVLRHEPHGALFVPDDDPQLFYRAITSYAIHALRPGGRLLFETNTALTDATARLMSDLGMGHVSMADDCFGKPRFACGTRIQALTAT